MTTTPDDGGTFSFIPPGKLLPAYDIRAHLAAQFAAAWLPIVCEATHDVVTADKAAGIEVHIMKRANELGLAQADDLLRRLKGEQT